MPRKVRSAVVVFLFLIFTAGGRLDAARYSGERIEDLRARSWAHVANARRIRSDPRGAEEAFQRAWADLEKGDRRLLERAGARLRSFGVAASTPASLALRMASGQKLRAALP